MRVPRTFTLDIGIVLQLKKQKNQSKFVEQAIRLKIREDERAKNRNDWDWLCADCDISFPGKKNDTWVFCPKCHGRLDQ
jgi:Zn finger protein HypA/HybF involved in hydrogenase expression